MLIKVLPQIARKIDKLTYGLFYPAFFGNMIYDLILAKTDGTFFLKSEEYWAGVLIVVFYALDFIHIYGDLDRFIGEKFENKTWPYILCDLATSTIFFCSFVIIKYHGFQYAIILLGIVPAIIYIYKCYHPLNDTDKRMILIYAISSFVLMLGYYVIPADYNKRYFLYFLSAELLFYFYYVFFYYSKTLDRILSTPKLVEPESQSVESGTE